MFCAESGRGLRRSRSRGQKFYAHIPARFGVINPDAADPPVAASKE
jgi:hypothetical protein